MKDLGSELIGRNHDSDELRPDEFWAVKDVSFELRRGECLGLIGRNGAGKTTLLRMLNGLIKPDKGRIEMRGRVGALIALGAGFNPILTGRENIYVNAAVLGLSKKETDEKIEEILEFAELGEFIDAPVQTYSSGMQVRLGFAVSTTLDPDILILDEILAVGDATFRHKCYHRINKLITRAAVIMVSHSMDHIAHISSLVAVMRQGNARLYEDTVRGIAAYHVDNPLSKGIWSDGGQVRTFYPPVCSVEVHLFESNVSYGGSLSVEVLIECLTDLPDVIFSFTAVNLSEQPVMCWHTSRRADRLDLHIGAQRVLFTISPLLLNNGDYYWNFNATRRGSIEHFIWFMRAGRFSVVSDFRQLGNIPYIADTSDLVIETLESDGNRDRGRSHDFRPLTPPGIRVRTRRFKLPCLMPDIDQRGSETLAR
ncbi:MAG TPA: ABC transporter ATP-binding protein [Deltaproteobacteria bacterium]|nr:ABC transporter ATP-binding protein [Deltaproteobacteria bacterium]